MITKPRVQKIRIRKWLEGIDAGTTSFGTPDKVAKPIADIVVRQTDLGADEEPLLVNYRSDSEWCLLTTKRLIWFQEGQLNSLAWHEITGAQQPPEKAAQIIREELGKDKITELEIFDATDRKCILQLEAGDPYYIIWSAILAFSKRTRKPDPIPL